MGRGDLSTAIPDPLLGSEAVRRSHDKVWRLRSWLACGYLAACGGTASVSPDASPLPADASGSTSAPDATVSGAEGGAAAEASAQDATTPPPGDSGASNDVSDVGAGDDDASEQADAPPPSTAVETCEAVWPQPDGVFFDTSAPQGVQMVVDATGNVYLALSYGGISYSGNPSPSAPPPALGVSNLPGYPLGLALVKLDAACNLLWARELGTPDVNTGFIQSVGLAVDSASNVTILGSFRGPVDLGDGTVMSETDAAPVLSNAFLIRLDATGALVFRDVFESDAGFVSPVGTPALAVSPAGISTILVGALGNVSFGPPAPDDAGDANAAGDTYDAGRSAPATQFLIQLDTMGRVLQTLAPPSSALGVLVGADGTLWAQGSATWDGGAGPVLMHLSASADPIWSVPAPASTLLAVGGPGVVAFDNGYQATEGLWAYSSDGTLLWSRPPSAYPIDTANQSMAIDSNGNIIVGGLLQGTTQTSADGSTTTTSSPAGIGYETFDSMGVLQSVRVFDDQDADVGSERFLALGVDPTGHVIVAGTNQGPGGWNTTSLFVAKFAPSP
jgi:hypothetical protein